MITFLYSLKNRSFELNLVQSFIMVAKRSERTRRLTVTIVALSIYQVGTPNTHRPVSYNKKKRVKVESIDCDLGHRQRRVFSVPFLNTAPMIVDSSRHSFGAPLSSFSYSVFSLVARAAVVQNFGV